MPFSVFFNNKTIVHPGSYTVVDVSKLKNIPISPVGVLCLLGTAPEGEPLTPLVFTNSADIKNYFGYNSSFAKVADIIFKPSNDARIASPSQVICVKVNNSTKAIGSDIRFNYTSIYWGRRGRLKNIKWLLNDGGTSTTLTPGNPNLTLKMWTYDFVDSSLNTDMTFNETKLKITNNSSNLYFFIYKEGYKVYVSAASSPTPIPSSYIEIDTSVFPSLKEALKAIDSILSAYSVSIELLSPKTDFSINDLDDVGTADNPIRLSPNESAYLKSLFYDCVQAHKNIVDIEVTNKRIEFGPPDPNAGTYEQPNNSEQNYDPNNPIYVGGVNLDNGGYLHKSISNPNDEEDLYLSIEDLEKAHDAANTTEANVIVPLWSSEKLDDELQMGSYDSSNGSWQSESYFTWLSSYKSYIEKRNSIIDSNEVFTVIGLEKSIDSGNTLNNFNELKKVITLAINSPYFAVTAQDVKITTNPTQWQKPWVFAAIIGSLITSIPLGTSLTYKSVNTLDTKLPFTFDLNKINNREQLILIGHLTVWKNFKTGLFQIAKGNTSYTAEDNDGFTDIGLVNLGLYFQKDFNKHFMTLVGQDISNEPAPGRITPILNVATIKDMAIGKFEQWRKAGYITNSQDPNTGKTLNAYRDIDIRISGKQIEFTATLTTVTGADWLLNRLYITLPSFRG